MKAVFDSTIDNLIGCKTYHQKFPDFGERAWGAKGMKLEVIYWDIGNSWCLPIQILPRNRIFDKEFKLRSSKFFQRLQKAKNQ